MITKNYSNLLNKLPNSASRLLSTIPHTRVVGGWIRDNILQFNDGKFPEKDSNSKINSAVDIDFATELLPEQIIDSANKIGAKVVPVGIEHGTVGVVIDGAMYEITTLRRDVLCDGRRAKVIFGVDWYEDAKRRDFTINAMSIDKNGTLYDYFDAITDLQQNRLNFIGNAEERIKEDYLRILRYFRFFGKIKANNDKNIEKIIYCNAEGLNNISGERIWSEMKKILTISPTFLPQVLSAMWRCGVWPHLAIPQQKNCDFHNTPFADGDPLLNIISLVTSISGRGKTMHDQRMITIENILERWKIGRKEKQFLYLMHNSWREVKSTEDRLLLAYQLGYDDYKRLLFAASILGFITYAEMQDYLSGDNFIQLMGTCPINGHDIISAFATTQKEVGTLLKMAHRIWLLSRGEIDKKGIIEKIIKMNEEKMF